MLKESFLIKLRAAFVSLFIEGHSVHDDTLLEKFATTLKEILLKADENDVSSVLEVFKSVNWIVILFDNYKKLDPRVVAFGLNVIGTMSTLKPYQQFLAVHTKRFLTELVNDYVNFHTSIRCSVFNMLKIVLATEMGETVFNGLNTTEMICRGLEDRSIFVQRATKDLTVDYLVSSLRLTTNNMNNGKDDHFDRIVDWITNLIRASDVDVRMGLIGLEVLLEVSEQLANGKKESQDIVSLFCKRTKIRVIATDTILSSDNERICVACCQLLLATNAWSFESGIPSQWTGVLDVLLKKQQPMTAVTFVVATCTRFVNQHRPIPLDLKSLLIAPLASCLEWKTNEIYYWSESSLWEAAFKEFDYDRTVLVKLSCFILASIPKLKTLLSTDEKVDFANRLLVTLLDTSNLLAISPKTQLGITSTLVVLLEDMVTDTETPTKSIEDCIRVWKNVICASEQPSSAALVSTQRMQMVRILIKWTDSEMKDFWNEEIGSRLSLLLQKRCHDIHWEVRDSAIETVGEIIKRSKELTFLQTWCIQSGLLKVTMANFDDTESYVRASILQVLSHTSDVPSLREEVTKIVSLEKLMSILLTDDEGVTRRAAARALLSLTTEMLTRSDALLDYQVPETFLIASSDLDWEVKLISVEFWQQIFEKCNVLCCNDQIGSQLEYLSGIGFNDALLMIAMDQDVSVRRKAATVIQRLKQSPAINEQLQLCASEKLEPRLSLPATNVAEGQPEQQRKEKMDFMNDKEKYEAIDNVLDTIDSEIVANVMILRPLTLTSSKSELQNLILRHHHFHRGRTSKQKFLHWLMNFNLDELSERNDQTTDVYHCNPEALLDDILVVNRESDIEDEEIALDCY